MIVKPLLALLLRDIVQNSVKEVVKKEVNNQLKEQIRANFLRVVADGFTREISHNLSQYIKSLGAISATIENDGEGEKLFQTLQRSLKYLEQELSRQDNNSPIILYLRERYGQQDILVGLASESVESMVSDEGMSEVWLNRTLEQTDVRADLSQIASELFEQLFQDQIDLQES